MIEIHYYLNKKSYVMQRCAKHIAADGPLSPLVYLETWLTDDPDKCPVCVHYKFAIEHRRSAPWQRPNPAPQTGPASKNHPAARKNE